MPGSTAGGGRDETPMLPWSTAVSGRDETPMHQWSTAGGGRDETPMLHHWSTACGGRDETPRMNTAICAIQASNATVPAKPVRPLQQTPPRQRVLEVPTGFK